MDARRLTGLSSAEAGRRLGTVGPNEVGGGGGRPLWRIVQETLREPMFLLLIGAAVLYLFLGDLGEGLFLVCGAVTAIGLVIVQEARSERALAALRQLAQPHARVVRDGAEKRVPARELVPGDILLIGEGERIPADGALVAGDVLSVDESALTGESAPVVKRPAVGDETLGQPPAPGAEEGPFVFAGTLLVRGQGVVQVARTGERSALGRIGASLAAIDDEPTPLQKTAGRLVGVLGLLAVAFCGVVAVAYGLLRDDWIGGALAGITVAIALIPEEFPMVLAVFLALGAWRLARHRVLARRSAVIETLGGATVLCVDKTGTLTENRMEVARIWADGTDLALDGGRAPTGAAADLLRYAALASAVRPVDPMDRAVHALRGDAAGEEALLDEEPERAWPLRPELLAVVQLWRLPGDARIAAAKGAPEAVFRLCRLPEAEVARLQQVIERYAALGLRVLGVASARSEGRFADEPQDVPFRFAGLLGFIDPLRPDAPAALQEARGAGIEVVMITGDHPATALAIAGAAGFDVSAGVMTGEEVAALSSDALRRRLRRVRVFARILPAQKLRIVEALKADGEVVAMTGDGINDAPALEAAHIGVAMGARGRTWRGRPRTWCCSTTVSRPSSAASGWAGGSSRTFGGRSPTSPPSMCRSPAWPSGRFSWVCRRCCFRCTWSCWSWRSTRSVPWCSRPSQATAPPCGGRRDARTRPCSDPPRSRSPWCRAPACSSACSGSISGPTRPCPEARRRPAGPPSSPWWSATWRSPSPGRRRPAACSRRTARSTG